MTTLEEFAKIKKEIAVLEEKAEGLKEVVLTEVQKVGEPIETDFGRLSVRFYKVYGYSPAMIAFEKKVKTELAEKQAREVESGVATVTERPTLFFKAN